jgi:hypothetical protein
MAAHPHFNNRPGASTAGYTLLELAYVFTIIGFIIGAIMVGESMIETAKSLLLISQFKQFESAFKLFKNKYHNMPGDFSCVDIKSYFGPTAQCGNQNLSISGTG